ncbi:MAG TPA: MFS transporter [Allosphingosinicella sp.]|nr:MFS transporter [Allosphingosinicella sp.]
MSSGFAEAGAAAPPTIFPTYTVVALTLCHVAAIASSQILNILVDPIRAALAVSDSQFSLLQGVAFALLAAVAGIPAARVADSGRRKQVIVAGVVGWTAGTLLCAVASTFGQLFLARVVVGLGEVFLFPAALSLLTDVTPRPRLGAAIGIFASGGPIGAAIALFGGGAIISSWPNLAELLGRGSDEGWRFCFVACVLLGMVALAFLLHVEEPRRAERGTADASFGSVLRYLARERGTFLPTIAGFLALCLSGTGLIAWAPSFAVRTLGYSFAQAGALIGTAALVFAVAGSWSAGMAVDRLTRSGDRGAALSVSLASLAGLVAAILLADAARPPILGAAAIFALFFFLIVPQATGPIALERITPAPMRAQMLAIYLLLINLVAQAGGPSAVALLTDHLFGAPAMVGWSMAIVCVAASAVGALLLQGGRAAYCALADRTDPHVMVHR